MMNRAVCKAHIFLIEKCKQQQRLIFSKNYNSNSKMKHFASAQTVIVPKMVLIFLF